MPKPIAVLTVLVESAGPFVSNEELMEPVWNLFKGPLPIVDQQERDGGVRADSFVAIDEWMVLAEVIQVAAAMAVMEL
jgi:hypothetical protein